MHCSPPWPAPAEAYNPDKKAGADDNSQYIAQNQNRQQRLYGPMCIPMHERMRCAPYKPVSLSFLKVCRHENSPLSQ